MYLWRGGLHVVVHWKIIIEPLSFKYCACEANLLKQRQQQKQKLENGLRLRERMRIMRAILLSVIKFTH